MNITFFLSGALLRPFLNWTKGSFLLICCFCFSAQAQPEFSKSELEIIKQKGSYSNAVKYRLPQEHFPNPEISQGTRPSFVDGDIDLGFNASVTEGFGYVNETSIQPDGRIIAVGLFQRANGTRTNGIARFNADGTIDPSFNAGGGANFAIRAVAVQSDGKIILGGAFTSFNGVNVNRLVRLNSNGDIDPTFNLGVVFNNQINDLLILPSGKIMVGGQFSLSSTRIVRLNSDGTLDTTITGFSSTVYSIALAPDGKIVVGGQFSLPRPTIARLNNDGSLDSTFNPTTGGAGPVFKTVVQPNGKVIAAGAFRTFNGTPVDGVVRLNDNGTIDSVFEITNDPEVQNLNVSGLALQPDGKILVGFFDDSSLRFADVRRFNADASPDTGFNTNSDNSLTVVDLNLLADGSLLASGFFVSINNQQRLRLVKLNSDGSLSNAFNPSVSTLGGVYTVKRQADGKIIIGGDFEYVHGVRRSAVARLNLDGSIDNSFSIGTSLTGDVYALAIQPDGKVVIGGLFAGDATFPASSAARVNSNGTFDVGLNSVENFINVCRALVLQPDGKILAGGTIFRQADFARLAAERFNSNGSRDTSFTSAVINGSSTSMVLQPSGKIVVGGTFFPQGGADQRGGIARLNSNGSLDNAFSSFVGNVYSLKQFQDGRIYAGGFTLTRFSSEGVIDTTLNTGTGFNSLIRAIEVQPDGKILAGGFFTSYNGSNVNRLIRVNPNGTIDPTFSIGSGPSGTIFSLGLQPDGKILVGGRFLDFNNIEKFSLVRLSGSSRIIRSPFDFDGDGKTDVGIFRPSAGEWWWNRSSDSVVNAVQFGSGTDVVAPGDFTGDGKMDIAVWRPSNGFWYVLRSEDFSFYAFPFGTSGDVPVTGDYDGDGKADAAVFRPANSTWYISRSSDQGTTIAQFGTAGDVPVTADYDGDGKDDIGIYRPNGASGGEWWVNRSTAGLLALQFGAATDKTVPADYTGDGKADVAFWRPSTGEWYILRSEDFSFYAVPFGTSGDMPSPGDYDGDGRSDLAVFRSSQAIWYIAGTTSGTQIIGFGLSGDRPIPNSYVR